MWWSIIIYSSHTASFEFLISPDLKVLTVKGLSSETFTQSEYRNSGTYNNYEKVILNYGITKLGNSVFSQSANLKYVEFPSSLQSIGESLFYQSPSIEYLIFPEGLTTIPFGTLRECSIQNVTFSSTVTSISGSSSFSNSLKKIIVAKGNPVYSTSEDGSLLIYNKTVLFQACGGCQTITVPYYIETIDTAFSNYRGVHNIIFEPNSRLTVVRDSAFTFCSISVVNFPHGLRTIGTMCFKSSGVTRVSLPSTLESVPDNLFYGASRLESVVAENSEALTITSSGVIMNKSCSAIIFLPKTTTFFNIPWTLELFDAVSMRTNRNFLTITADGNHSLYYAEDNLLYERINYNLRFIGAAGNLTEIRIHKNCTELGYRVFENSAARRVSFLGDRITELSNNPFYSSNYMVEIILPNSITKICAQSFTYSSCTKIVLSPNLTTIESEGFLHSRFTSVDMSHCTKLVKIDSRCFSWSRELSEVKLPPSLKYISKSLFNGCTNLERISINSSIINLIDENAFESCKLTHFSFTDVSKGSSLRSINLKAFFGSQIQSITIPDSVTSIGDEAFASCAALTDIVFGKESQLGELPGRLIAQSTKVRKLFLGPLVSKIREGSLSESYGLTEIEVSSDNGVFVASNGIITSANGSLLWACAGGRERAEVGSSVSMVMGSAFLNCEKLKEIIFDSEGILSEIGSSTFFGCTSLERLEFPTNLKVIGDKSFRGCRSLKVVSFGRSSSLKSVGVSAFADCSSLERIEIPQSVQTVSDFAFGDCVALEEVLFCVKRGAVGLSSKAFAGCSSLHCIGVSMAFESLTLFGLPVCNVLDKDCMHPTRVFTAGGEVVATASIIFGNLWAESAETVEVKLI